MGIRIGLGWAVLLVAGVLRAEPPAAEAVKAADAELFGKATVIVSGRLSERVAESGGDRSAVIESIKPLMVRVATWEGGGWPGHHPDDKINLHLTAEDAFKPGDEGVWLLTLTEHGYVAKGAGNFRPEKEKKAFVAALDEWMQAETRRKMEASLAALKKDPEGDKEATWKGVREFAILLECELVSPAYEGRANENPMRTHLAEFSKGLGLESPVAPNPQTAEEVKRATPILKVMLYVPSILDHPDDPKYAAVFERCLQDYWRMRLDGLNHTLAATPEEMKGEEEMRRRLGTKESVAREFPPGVEVTRMLLFRGGLPAKDKTP